MALRNIAEVFIHLWELLCHACRALFHALFHPTSRRERAALILGSIGAIALVIAAVLITMPLSIEDGTSFWKAAPKKEPPPIVIDFTKPVREIPKNFRANQKMPRRGEGASSGSIDDHPFNPEKDLIRIEDSRVWWESEHDTNDTEDDHVFHYAMRHPMKRLIELVTSEGATLKVQDAYRDKGIHARKSLHKQGRAVDVTAKDMSLGRLSSLAWAAGFDWVYCEFPKRGGAHVHASVTPTNSPRYP